MNKKEIKKRLKKYEESIPYPERDEIRQYNWWIDVIKYFINLKR